MKRDEKTARDASPVPWISRADAPRAAFLGLLVAVFYLPAVGGGFVWDDVLITKLRAVSSWEGILWIWFDPVRAYFQADVAENHYWPVVYTTFWLEHKLWGFHPAGYHVINILLHFANTALIWRLLARLAVPGALFAAALFAVHPLHTESVAWAISRKDLLCALFYLCALLAWVRFTESPRRRLYATALSLLAAAMLCKSIAITFPAALLILQWWRRGRFVRADVIHAVPFFLVALVFGGADLWFYKMQGLHSFDYSLAERTVIAARALWFYVGKLLWPAGLAVIYPLWEIRVSDLLGLAALAGAVAAVAALWTLRGRIGRGPLACVLFFGATLSPTLGFIDYDYMRVSFVADRYQYLAGAGLIVLFAAAAVRAAGMLPPAAGKAAKAAALATLVLLGCLTWRQSGIYKDELTFFDHVLSLNPRAYGAHYNIGLEMFRLGRIEDSERYFRLAVETDPGDQKAVYNLGEILRGQQKYSESLEAYRSAIEMKPDDAKAHFAMGKTLFALGRREEAVSSMKRAAELQTNPHMLAETHDVIGRTLEMMGRRGEAEKHFDLSMKARLALNPRSPEAFLNRAETFRRQKRYEESLRWYRSAIEMKPDYALAYMGMGDSLYRTGQYDEAISSMRRAISLWPSSPLEPTLRYLMGQAAREAGRPEEAAQHYENAMLTAPGFADPVAALADLRLEGGRYKDALALYLALAERGAATAVTHQNIGIALLNTGRTEEAARSFRQALSLDPSLERAREGLKRARGVEARGEEEENADTPDTR